jgi:hypothetical protein
MTKTSERRRGEEVLSSMVRERSRPLRYEPVFHAPVDCTANRIQRNVSYHPYRRNSEHGLRLA